MISLLVRLADSTVVVLAVPVVAWHSPRSHGRLRTVPVLVWASVFDWNDLRYFLAVQKAGTLAGAARELGVKHTTVARRIAALEQDLGSQLLRRSGDHYTLTPAGTALLATAEEMKAQAAAIQRRVSQPDAKIEGVVRVTPPETVGGYLVRNLSPLRDRYPDLVVNVLSEQRVFDLLAGEADIAIRLHPKAEGDLIERKLCVAAWSVYASRAYVEKRGIPAAAEEFARHDLIGFDDALAGTPGGTWFRETLPDAQFVLRGNSISQIFTAALLGYGITSLPCFMGDAEPLLVRVMPHAFHNRMIRMLVPADLTRLSRVRAVMDYLVELFTRDAALFAGETHGPTG